jgi:pimeloyl-ACP methyl ester carboxylesterase
MGGYIAQELALRHPSRVDKLILLATAGGTDGYSKAMLKALTTVRKSNVSREGFVRVMPGRVDRMHERRPAPRAERETAMAHGAARIEELLAARELERRHRAAQRVERVDAGLRVRPRLARRDRGDEREHDPRRAEPPRPPPDRAAAIPRRALSITCR